MPTPTVILVHGAFTDAASWLGVIHELKKDGISVIAPSNPLRGLASDAAYIASLASQIDGPVILVGHSYGGALITVAGAAENVVGLVYVAAYMLDEEESVGELQGRFPASALVNNLQQWTYPTADGGIATEVTIAEEAFPRVFAADVAADLAGVLASTQRPLCMGAFGEAAPVAAWKTKPSWALIAGADQAINPEVERFGAERAAATTVEIDGASHAVVLSQPKAVTRVILDAVHSFG
ncbi:alpha/beta hydrolase [Streptomyces viridiviolaceus]|uniref:Alpha/beta fold hydrolase n=1 Tax=Streptomyces viridiviolaceus TaxID=68282 RepID=A0ABW2EFU3_9ACTN|nr:alpha/beta hydrolase [Streptomyces viridiviolaceus]GHB65647.1 alpha/beta hydrolase [Streptomyces viridiviolaceus]